MPDKTLKTTQENLEPLSQRKVIEMKSAFKSRIDKRISKATTDHTSKKHTQELRKFILVKALNRSEPPSILLKNLAELDTEILQTIVKAQVSVPFNAAQRHATKSAAKTRYKNRGHGLLGTSHRRLYFPLITNDKKSDAEKDIEIYLNKKEYFITDYKQGYATDITGKQHYKIGKLLKRNPILSPLFMSDHTRVAGQQYLVLSDHVNDIAYMSTNRGWETCMSHNGDYNDRPINDIEEGSLVAYLISKNDPHIYNPLARVLFKPLHDRDGHTAYHVNKCYGLHNDAFKKTAEHIANKILNTKSGLFKIPDAVYKDEAPERKVFHIETISAEEFLYSLNIDYTKDDSGKITVNGNLDISRLNLTQLPDLTKVKVTGRFICHSNLLTSLVGSPQDVGKGFSCIHNHLTSLVGAPSKINGDFDCDNNKLENLIGAPQEVKYGFYCTMNLLKSLAGAPKKVGTVFNCHSNLLKTLDGAPQEIGTDFYCSHNQLTSLIGTPKIINGDFYCRENLLTTLENGPEQVIGDFRCDENKLKSLIGGPKIVHGEFFCKTNNLSSLIGAPTEVRGDINFLDNPLRNLIGAPQNFSLLLTRIGHYKRYNDIPKRYLETQATTQKSQHSRP